MKRISLVLGVLCATNSAAGADSFKKNRWRGDLSAYFMFTAMSGEAQAVNSSIDVDVDFQDYLKYLEFGGGARGRVGYGRWALSIDAMYSGLGARDRRGTAEGDRWLFEPTVGFHVTPWLEPIAGVRYTTLSLDLRGDYGYFPSGRVNIWDPIIGANFDIPVLKTLSVKVRADIGGFGVGSNLSWQLFPQASWQFGNCCSAELGYRLLGTDYERGSGATFFAYDVVTHGPQLGVSYHF